MAAIKQISGTQASYANLNSQSGLSFVATSNVPPWSSAEGVLRAVEGQTASLRIDANTVPAALSVGDHYWMRFAMRIVRGVGAVPASKLDTAVFFWDGTRLASFKMQTNSDGSLGWTPVRTDNLAGGTADGIMVDAGPEATKAWGEWCDVHLHIQRHGSTGQVRVFIDGTLFSWHTGVNTDILWTTGFNANSFLIALPAWTGAYFEIAGPIESWSGTDIAITPRWELIPTGALATKMFLPFATAQAGGLVQGCHGQVSGTGAIAVGSEYLNQTGSPCRHRLEFSGNGNLPVWTTIPKVGALPFNEQGWGHVVISDLLVPTSGYAIWQVSKDDGSPLWRFYATGGSLFVSYDNGAFINLGPWTHATVRYQLLLHLHAQGRASFTQLDLTQNPGVGAGNVVIANSQPLCDWSPQALGVMSLTANPTASNVEMGFMGVFARPTLYGIDSLSTAYHTPGSGNTTVLANATLVARAFPMQRECQCLPGANWPLKELGLERRVLMAPLGRAGLLRRDHMRNALAQLSNTRGCEVIAFDVGSINDLAMILTGSDAVTLGEVIGNVEAFFDWAVSHDVAVWVGLMLPRGRSFTISGISTANPAVVTLSAAHGMATGSGYRAYISGVVGNAAMQNAVNGKIFQLCSATTGGSTITLPTIANGGPDTSGGTYTSGGTVLGFSPQESAAITSLNAAVRRLASKYQASGLIRLSDLEADVAANPATYPNNATFWADPTHPTAAGGLTVAQRMLPTRYTPPANATRRRWPLRLLGR